MSSAHSILPPSGAGAWRKCAMWPTMNRLYPQPDTEESKGGTAAHWAFAEMHAGRPVSEGMQAPNGVFITDEMIEGAQLICKVIESRGLTDAFIEQPISCAYVHPDCWGTPDVYGIRAVTTIEIIDYKFGHQFVDEFENDQCVTYVAGIIEKLFAANPGLADQHITVNITIVQPRCFYKGSPVRTWSINAADLRAQINILAAAAARALAPNPPAVTNSECCYCPGRHACPALQKAAYADAEYAVTSAPVELDPVAASLELKMLERALARLKARVDGLQETVLMYGRQGKRIPWHRLEQGTARAQWTAPVTEVIALGEIYGKPLAKPGVLTPNQAIKAGIDEAVIKAYSVTPLGTVKLVPDNPADARRVFGKS